MSNQIINNKRPGIFSAIASIFNTTADVVHHTGSALSRTAQMVDATVADTDEIRFLGTTLAKAKALGAVQEALAETQVSAAQLESLKAKSYDSLFSAG